MSHSHTPLKGHADSGRPLRVAYMFIRDLSQASTVRKLREDLKSRDSHSKGGGGEEFNPTNSLTNEYRVEATRSLY